MFATALTYKPVTHMNKDVSQFLIAAIVIVGVMILLGMKAINEVAGMTLLGGVAGNFFGATGKQKEDHGSKTASRG